MLASSFPRSPSDTASVFLRYLAEHLHHQHIELHILAPAYKDVGTANDDGVTVHRFGYLPRPLRTLAYGSGILANLKRNPLLWFTVPFFIAAMFAITWRLTRRLRPQLIHAHWILPQGFIAILVKAITGTPVIITSHGSDAFALRGFLSRQLKRITLARADLWTANTRATAEAIGTTPGQISARIVPMGVDVDRFSSGQRTELRSEIPDNHHIILCVGRLVEKKGVRYLIEAFSLLPNRIQERTHLWIVGTGDEFMPLQQLAEQLGILRHTRFTGEVANADLPDYYSAADLFVSPSAMEGQGVVFLEAFAAQCCVIASNVGGIPEIIQDGKTGILVNPGNPHQLAQAIQALLENPELRTYLSNNAHAFVAQHFAWPKIARQFIHLYRELTTISQKRIS